MRVLALLLAVAGGCATTGEPAAQGPASPRIDRGRPAYWIWFDGGWHVRATTSGHGHRFQGSVSGTKGAVRALHLTDESLASSIALVDGAIQFDFEPTSAEPGFDAEVAGDCARFDLYLDGKRVPGKVHLGASGRSVHALPVEKCP